MANIQSKLRILKLERSILRSKLRQAIEENTKRDARVEELEQKNIELENRLAILEQGKKEKKTRGYATDTPISDITDNTLNSNDTHEQIVSHNEESNISSYEVTASGNSDIYQESVTPTPIPAETISMEEKEENEFLKRVHKEQISNEIRERNREKKHRSKDLSSDNNSSEQSNLCDIKTVTLETNPKDSTEVSEEETKSRVYDSSNLNMLEICPETKSPTNQKIPYNQKVERGLRYELSICIRYDISNAKSGVSTKAHKIFDIQIPEFSLETILTGSCKVTAQNIVDLFKVAMKKSNDMNCQEQSTISSETKVIGVTNCHAHMSDLSNSNDSLAELTRSKLPEIEVSEEAKKTLPETEATHDHTYFRNKILLRYSDLYKIFITEKFDHYGIIEGSLCPVCKLNHDEKSVKAYFGEMTLCALTPEYLDWYAKLVEVPSSLTDKIRLILYRAYTEETGLDPWIKSETSEFPQIEKDAEEKTLFVPRVNIQSTPSKRQFPISVLPKDPEERQQHVINMRYLVARKLKYLYEGDLGHAEGVSIAICYSCNKLVYSKIGSGYECEFRHFMNEHWTTNCTGNDYCDISYKDYMELKNKPEAELTNSFYEKEAIHRYELWMQNAIRRVKRAREIGRKIRACITIQRKIVEWIYRPDGLTATELALHYACLQNISAEMRQVNNV
ncbi:hypothetical protein G9A89_021254 [Geosiphon pyriformis]|nr:hypothetical protein G9A89_021254 [Geosiphon pyriformis]